MHFIMLSNLGNFSAPLVISPSAIHSKDASREVDDICSTVC